jgi:NAD(P)-dependent dehydrogenase (short-subunit alcohol dehydrogenase family)
MNILLTGASRGIGAATCELLKSRGHDVVGHSSRGGGDFLAGELTDPDAPRKLWNEAQARLGGRIDVLVNNAGNFYAGFFEELPPEDFRAQIETNLFGPVNVTRAVLPVMRAGRAGLVVTMSSIAGITGQPFVSAYAAAKFGLEGWMESLTAEVAPFGIRTMLVEPGFFRTELLTEESTKYPQPSIDDYAETTRATVTAWKAMNGLQGGDPVKLAKALVQLAGNVEPPLRWPAGADAVDALEQKARTLEAQANAHRQISVSLGHENK